MPKVDGREVLKQIKQDPQLRKIPVIMLTTTAEAKEINQCYEMGCSFYMVKPSNYNEFMASVEHLGGLLSMAGVEIPVINPKGAQHPAAGEHQD